MKPSDVKLSTIELPQKLTKLGASQVQLSPDSAWLCLIQEGLKVIIAKFEPTESSIAVSQVSKVARIKRQIPQYIKNGGLGSYDRNISHVSFSADSRILAVADLAGYIDTWVRASEPGKAEEDSSSDESESEEESVTDSGEHWVRNPAGKLIPKLPSTPVVLSFSDDVPAAKEDYTLVAITNTFTLLAFHPLEGALTPWSRRNPRRVFPGPILDLLDLPKGIVWQGERAWIYGVSFLVMIDLSIDFPKPAEGEVVLTQAGSKRKRTGGAGGRMVLGNMTPHKIHRHVDGEEEDIDIDDNTHPSDESDDDEIDSGELTQLRNAGNSEGGEVMVRGEQKKSWWMTYKYRPIFGVVSLGQGELALVERPSWDTESKERYFGGDEWER